MIVALGALVFVLAAVLDIADTRHKIAIEQRDAHAAARWSVAMYLLGLVGLVGLLRVSLWLIVPEALGLYLGSVFAVRRAQHGSSAPSSAKLQNRDFVSH